MSVPGTSGAMDTDIQVTKERDDEIEKIFKIVEIIFEELGAHGKHIIEEALGGSIDFDVSDEVSGFLMTIFTALRKEENDKPGHIRYMAYEVKILDQQLTVKGVVEKIKARNINLNFLVATPIVEILTVLKGFFDEVRTGVTKFKVREEVARRSGVKRDKSGKILPPISKTDRTHNISMYGLNNQHIPLLQGITLPPERRTGILRSLGPLTQATLLVMETKYHSKLTNALKYSTQMLPMHNEIAQCLKEAASPGVISGVMKELGDILLLTTSRATQKIYFPLLVAFTLWHVKPEGFQWSFSGSAMLKYYTEAINRGVKFTMRSRSDGPNTAEMVFHAMFGTYLEDLGVLSGITSKSKWHHRKDLNSVFVDRAKKNKISFTTVKFKYVSKMAQALQTRTLGNVDPCTTSRPSFTGHRQRNFTQEFATYLSTGKSAASYSNDPSQLHFALKKVKEDVMKDMDSVKLLHSGTKEWEEFTGETWIPSSSPINEFLAQ